jgi:DNA-binding response OmpR family regulator
MRILVVEDERAMANLLKRGLEEEHHSVSVAADGRTALELAEGYEFDLILLDVMLPGLDGLEVARRLRSHKKKTPILMLTARDAVPDIVNGLNAGADDYLTKPFSFAELLARIRALSRRAPEVKTNALHIADLELDTIANRVTRAGEELRLTPTEFRLLEFLMRRSGRVASRQAIIEAVWGLEEDIEENTLDAFVRLLRRKVDEGHARKLIHTARGFGYYVKAEAGE